MRAIVADRSILVTGHGPETGWRRCTSGAAFQLATQHGQRPPIEKMSEL
jgi:hypothetical protein